jgi:glycosyltransferase involved in cell wall biosynthesis
MTLEIENKNLISVVIPVFNEEESVCTLYNQVKTACEISKKKFELFFVDDGSRDSTPEILKTLSQSDARVKAILFRKNYGQTAAMAAGFSHARGDVIVSMDGDLQNDPADIPLLMEKLDEGYDIVCGWRKNRQDKFWSRKFPSMIANWIIGRVTGVRIHDNGCSLKAYRASTIKNTILYSEMHRFIPAMATLTGARVTEVVVNHHARRFGQSKYGIGRVWRVFFDIITVKMIIGFVSRPALWFALWSIPFVCIGLLFLLVSGGLYLEFIESWLMMTTSGLLFLFLSAHLFIMGVIGELLLRTGDFTSESGLKQNVKIL